MPGKHSVQNYDCRFISIKVLWLETTERKKEFIGRMLGYLLEVNGKLQERDQL